MHADSSGDRQQVHALVDRLAPSQVRAVRGLLEAMLDPVARALSTAPDDDEPVTAEDRERLRRGREWFAARGGKGIPMEDVLAEFGLTPEDVSAPE